MSRVDRCVVCGVTAVCWGQPDACCISCETEEGTHPDTVRAIRTAHSRGVPIPTIAEEMGINYFTAYKIVTGRARRGVI